ncbi:MAG TPA: phospho-N-acetylmuramoyl-pentapeptide-transferase [Candidatus Baltobacteraceae bacterium]|nr:phospho-N-acetylmuramoyl-pentapeptide-transferase [Candidatus Baltobacteraceae bacterium]
MNYGYELALVAAGFLLSAIAGAVALPLLARLQFRQHAYEDAPQTHQTKTGTPTMGGIVFVVALLPLLMYARNPVMVATLLLVALCGLIGFIDDYTAIRRGKNAGLRARTKYLLTALAAVAYLWWISASGTVPVDVIFHMRGYVLAVPHWLWLLLGIFAVTGTIHAVNLTDGLDGLVSGTIVPPLVVLGAIAWRDGSPAPNVAALLGVGACFGFLLYNRHPAKLFMGDTGSLALGALLSAVAILTGEMLLLVLVGGVFVAEALSVIIQVTYFKRTGGKRIFRMSPLHHHFELSGWPETTVTSRFWLASVVLSGLGLAIVR